MPFVVLVLDLSGALRSWNPVITVDSPHGEGVRVMMSGFRLFKLELELCFQTSDIIRPCKQNNDRT